MSVAQRKKEMTEQGLYAASMTEEREKLLFDYLVVRSAKDHKSCHAAVKEAEGSCKGSNSREQKQRRSHNTDNQV